VHNFLKGIIFEFIYKNISMNSKTILAHLLVTSFMISFSQSYESHKYETLFSEGNFEVRNYEPVLKAKTYSEKGSNDNFGKLFRYISGYNEKNQKISMTTPVYMKQEDEKSMMEFVLPSKFSLENVSQPLSNQVEIYKDNGGLYASVRYSGYSNSSKRSKQRKLLIQKLKELDINPFGDFLYLSYDSPYKFYNRRNEVVVAIKDFEKIN
tara:strand:+ start:2819 stop:3445 length:627 start_codon:yes stop_codon:yes gene_type:complete